MKTIIPHKQILSHSCLVTDFLMLLEQQYGIRFSEKAEEEILIKGMRRKHSFYMVGIAKEVFRKYKKKINMVVDNKYFANILRGAIKDRKNFSVVHQKITLDLIKELVEKRPIICHIDDNYLGDYSHASHFIILEKVTNKKISIVDPMKGKRSLISHKKLEDSILSLKKHVKMCPLLFYV